MGVVSRTIDSEGVTQICFELDRKTLKFEENKNNYLLRMALVEKHAYPSQLSKPMKQTQRPRGYKIIICHSDQPRPGNV